jgi:hypothetical protein
MMGLLLAYQNEKSKHVKLFDEYKDLKQNVATITSFIESTQVRFINSHINQINHINTQYLWYSLQKNTKHESHNTKTTNPVIRRGTQGLFCSWHRFADNTHVPDEGPRHFERQTNGERQNKAPTRWVRRTETAHWAPGTSTHTHTHTSLYTHAHAHAHAQV